MPFLISLNGQPCETSAQTVSALVAELAQAPEMLLIEHNGTALHRSEWSGTPVAAGDRIEILRVAAGG